MDPKYGPNRRLNISYQFNLKVYGRLQILNEQFGWHLAKISGAHLFIYKLINSEKRGKKVPLNTPNNRKGKFGQISPFPKMILTTSVILASFLILFDSESVIRDSKSFCKWYPEYCFDENIEVRDCLLFGFGCVVTTEVAPVVQWDKLIKDSVEKLQSSNKDSSDFAIKASLFEKELKILEEKVSGLKSLVPAFKELIITIENSSFRGSSDLNIALMTLLLAEAKNKLNSRKDFEYLQPVVWCIEFVIIALFIAYRNRPAVGDGNALGDSNVLANGESQAQGGEGNQLAVVPGNWNAVAHGEGNNSGGRENSNVRFKDVGNATICYITNHNYLQSSPAITPSTNSPEHDTDPHAEPDTDPVYSSLRGGRRRRVA